jgi:hypothetical protein
MLLLNPVAIKIIILDTKYPVCRVQKSRSGKKYPHGQFSCWLILFSPAYQTRPACIKKNEATDKWSLALNLLKDKA